MNEEINKPNFLGVGAMKSATTWVSECLRYHPEIFISDIKELHYFSNNLDKGSKWYFSHFEKVSNQTKVGEFSVSYMDDLKYADRIFDLLGVIKIIISIRNPLERFVSHYKHNCRVDAKAAGYNNEYIDYHSFKKSINDFPELLGKGLYANSIDNFTRIFGKENVLVVFKDDIDKDPTKTVKLIYSFLGVSQSFVPPILEKKVSLGIIPKWAYLEKARVQLYRYIKQNLPRIIPLIRKYRIAEMYRKMNGKNSEFEVDQKVIEYMMEYYAEDIQKLENKFNRDLSSWKKYKQ